MFWGNYRAMSTQKNPPSQIEENFRKNASELNSKLSIILHNKNLEDIFLDKQLNKGYDLAIQNVSSWS